MKNELGPYLVATTIVDWQEPWVMQRAKALAAVDPNPESVARRCFEWVRDEIAHSIDGRKSEVTCSASEVLSAGHGYCYAKSHLLAALLRANGIPCGFDYQRLRDGDQFVLHGLNTLYLARYGWYRVDARGNRPGVDGRFAPPREWLAWSTTQTGEVDYGLNLAEPLPEVVSVLRRPLSVAEVLSHLPSCVRMG